MGYYGGFLWIASGAKLMIYVACVEMYEHVIIYRSVGVWVQIYAGVEVIYENNQQDVKITTFEYHIIRELYEEMHSN